MFLLLFLFFLSTYGAIAFYVTTPKPTQPFIGFGVYSQQGLLAGYLSSGSTVTVNRTVSWTLDITNQMGSIQFLLIVYRIGNTTLSSPNATSPAPLPALTNSTLFAPNGRTTVANFSWNILKATLSGGLEYLALGINGEHVVSNIGTSPGSPFRLFFELWTFDESLGSFRYYSWLQVWFSVGP